MILGIYNIWTSSSRKATLILTLAQPCRQINQQRQPNPLEREIADCHRKGFYTKTSTALLCLVGVFLFREAIPCLKNEPSGN